VTDLSPCEPPRTWSQMPWGKGYWAIIALAVIGFAGGTIHPDFEAAGTISLMVLDVLLPVGIAVAIFGRRSQFWQMPTAVAVIVGTIVFVAAVGAIWVALWIVWFTTIFHWPK
jgi:hypothetical protein